MAAGTGTSPEVWRQPRNANSPRHEGFRDGRGARLTCVNFHGGLAARLNGGRSGNTNVRIRQRQRRVLAAAVLAWPRRCCRCS